MALTVVVRSGELATPPSVTFDAPRIVLGRGKGCEVLLPDPSVSQRHASIRQRGTDYVVIDEGSTNGTFVGPVRLSAQAPRVLRSGDLLRLGRIWLEVKIEQAPLSQDPKLLTREIALGLVARALGTEGVPAGARIRVAKGPDMTPVLVVTDSDRAYVVGRGSDVDLSLEDEDLSRRHVEIARRGLGLVVRDLGSKNGSELAGARLTKGRETPWPEGALLVVGQTELVYDDPVRAALEELESVADEQMQSDDAVDPPTGAPAAVTESSQRAERARAPGSVEAPVNPRRAPRNNLRILDAFVATIALLVLGLSLLGLWLLFRT